MVLQKRLDYGFNGYQVPPTPKAIRSARRRRPVRKNGGDNQMCAFDLLATVAGELLEGNSSLSPSFTLANEGTSIIKKEVEHGDQGRPHKSITGSQLIMQVPAVDHSVKQLSFASTITASNVSEKARPVVKVDNGSSEIQMEGIIASTGYQKPFDCILDNKNKEAAKTESLKTSKADDIGSLDDQVVRDRKSHVLVDVGNNEKLPFCTKQTPKDLFGACQDNIKLGFRDDDENVSGCTEPSTTGKVFRPQQYIGDQRIRKLLASKYWKATPGLKDEEQVNNTYSDIKPGFQSRKISYRRRRSQRDFPFKKRKLYEYSSVSNSDEGISSEAITSCQGKSFGYDVSDPAFARSASVAGHHGSFESAGSHVKLRIRSFKVPELFIEVPESATVGSLKRKVMEAVTSILGGGLRVGVLLQGKKIRDDHKTLLQTGISQDTNIDALGFSLEPNPSQDRSPLCHEDTSFLLARDTPQPHIRYPSAPGAVHNVAEQKNVNELTDPPSMNLVSFVESEHDSAPSPPAISTEKSLADSRALVAVPGMNAEALSAVPMRKPKRSESAQRRIRRPFSVSEVEALVQAVEKLGTGRWRDVKLRAFDNAKHRTYVDLKDKWKTLVHTARISPQQRRGEPVPQELLDRVLNAHAYWSQQQAKQHLRQSETCRLF